MMRFANLNFFRSATLSTVICVHATLGAEYVPFVGCPGNLQGETIDLPTGHDMPIDASPSIAQQLAFYKGPLDFGVFAPRGWHCYASGGSAGYSLEIYPDAFVQEPEYIVLVSTIPGDTVWITEAVAKYENRLFPTQAKPFVDKYLDMLREMTNDQNADKEALLLERQSGPFLTDTLIYEGRNIVRFVTPPNFDGFGTSLMKKSNEPIYGISRFYGDLSSGGLTKVAVRLPNTMAPLVDQIIASAKVCLERNNPGACQR